MRKLSLFMLMAVGLLISSNVGAQVPGGKIGGGTVASTPFTLYANATDAESGVNGTEYASLSAALAAVTADDAVIKVTGSLSTSYKESAASKVSFDNIIIDLNGKTLKLGTSNKGYIGFESDNLSLTVKNGTLSSGSVSGNFKAANNGINITLENANVTNTYSSSPKKAIDLASGKTGFKLTTKGNCTIDGVLSFASSATIDNQGVLSAVIYIGENYLTTNLDITNSSALTLSSDPSSCVSNGGITLTNSEMCTLNMNTFKGKLDVTNNEYTILDIQDGNYSDVEIENNGNMSISNGRFITTEEIPYSGTGSMEISGGTFSGAFATLLGNSDNIVSGYAVYPTLLGSEEGFLVLSSDPTQLTCEASIQGDSKTYYFATIDDALAATSDSYQTINLLKDVSNKATFTTKTPTTIELGGHTLTVAQQIKASHNLTLKNGTVIATANSDAILVNYANIEVTFNNVTVSHSNSTKYAFGGNNKNVTVNCINANFSNGTLSGGTNTLNVDANSIVDIFCNFGSANKTATINNNGQLVVRGSCAYSTDKLIINNNAGSTGINMTVKGGATLELNKTAGSITLLEGNYYDNCNFTGNVGEELNIEGGYFAKNDETYAWLQARTTHTIVETVSNNIQLYGIDGGTTKYAAKVGDKFYKTLADAVAVIPDNEQTELLIVNDCEATNITLSANKNIVLNLGGNTISNTANATTAIFIVNGNLEVNATTNQAGQYVAGFNGKAGSVLELKSTANVTVNGGKFISNAECSSANNRAIFNLSEGGTLTINNGVFVGSPLNNYQGSIIEARSKQTTITINGGTFSAINETSSTGGQALIWFSPTVNVGSTLTITGGTFTISRDKTQYRGNNCFTCVEALGQYNTLVITGGTFENATPEQWVYSEMKGYYNALTVYDYLKSVTIKNASFKSYGKAAWIYALNTGLAQMDIQDVTFISEGHRALELGLHKEGQIVKISGGVFKAAECGIVMGSNGAKTCTVEISNCDIDAASYGVYIATTTSNIYISGGKIVGQSRGINMAADANLYIGGNANIVGGKYGIYNNGANSHIAVSGGRIKATADNGIVTYNAAGTFVLTGGVYNIKPIIDDAVTGHVTLGEGLSIIDNPDQTTLAMGYLYTVGRQEEKGIQPTGETTDWGTASTWTDGENNVIPTISDDVTIPAGMNVVVGESGHTDAVANKVTIEGTDESNQGNLRVKTGNSLTVDELLTVGEPSNQYGQAVVEAGGRLVVGNASDQMIPNIILQDDGEHGTGVMLFNPETTDLGNIQATIELRTNARKISEGNYFWNYIGIPLKTDNFTADNWEKVPVVAGQETGSYLQTWDFTEGWVNNGLEAFKPFQGVAITNDSKDGVIYRFKGTMVGNADKNMVFKPRGYNFFANSYTAPIDIETLLNELKDNGVVDAAVYMFDTENNRFQSVALSAFAGFIPPYFRVIPSMNGFFILNQQTQVSGQTMDYGDAVYNCALGNRPIYAPAHEAMNFSRVHINVEANGSKDGLYLIENDEFTSEFENGYDVIKYMTEGQSNIYAQTTAGRQSELFNSNIEGTMIGFQSAANQTMYTLSFDEVQGETFMLTDMVTGEMVVMNEDNTYTFFAQAGQNNDNRFMVTRVNKAPTAMDNVKGNVKAQGIYSVMGHYFGNVTEWNRLPQGVYMVNGVKVVKY